MWSWGGGLLSCRHVLGSHLCIEKLIFKTQTGEMLSADRKGEPGVSDPGELQQEEIEVKRRNQQSKLRKSVQRGSRKSKRWWSSGC